MPRKTKAKNIIPGESSSSHWISQRGDSLVEEVREGGMNGGEGTATGGEVGVTGEPSGTLLELDLLDCPVCCHALTNPIFQCDNGHIACSSCCINLRNKCPSCTLPIGVNRCRIMERVVGAIMVPCPNAKHGCTEKFSYGTEMAHEKDCRFGLCYCPAPGCNYSGLCKNLYRHYHAYHLGACKGFMCGYEHEVKDLEISQKILVLQELRDGQEVRDGALVVVQCFEEEQGVYVTVKCIAPCAAHGNSDFSCNLKFWDKGTTMSFGFEKMKKTRKVSFQTPEEDFICIPRYFLDGRTILKMRISIDRVRR